MSVTNETVQFQYQQI